MKNMKRYSKQLFATAFAACLALSSVACAKEDEPPTLPEYVKQDFVFYGWWSPYDFTEEAYTLYKESGLNTVMFVNHSVDTPTSDNLHYLGSNATLKSLQLCKKVGLQAIPNYGYWYKPMVEGGEFGSTPFTDYDLYEEYKDIIVGMHIADEPSVYQMSDFGDDTLTADFKKAYDAPYVVNLYPSYASMNAIGLDGYRSYLQTYVDEIVMDFDEKNRLLSVDFYPFRNRSFHPSWLACYEEFAFAAKAAKGKQSYYIQTAIGNEFQDSLGVAEIAMQLNVAMAFGADWFGFYCYEMPRVYEGESYTPMYECTMMNPDGTPSPLYYAVQSETARLSAFSSAYLSYDWMKSVAVAGSESQQINQAFRYLSGADFADTSISQVSATKDTLVGCFNSDMGEAFMLVNYGNPVEKENSVIEMQFAKVEYAAVYGKNNEPQIVKLEEGKLSVELLTGEGCFVTLL